MIWCDPLTASFPSTFECLGPLSYPSALELFLLAITRERFYWHSPIMNPSRLRRFNEIEALENAEKHHRVRPAKRREHWRTCCVCRCDKSEPFVYYLPCSSLSSRRAACQYVQTVESRRQGRSRTDCPARQSTARPLCIRLTTNKDDVTLRLTALRYITFKRSRVA